MRRFKLFAVTMFVGALAVSTAALLFSVASASAQEAAWTVLPQPDPPFKGKIGLTPADSVKDFPKDVTGAGRREADRGTARAIPTGTCEERHRAVTNLTYVGEHVGSDGLANL